MSAPRPPRNRTKVDGRITEAVHPIPVIATLRWDRDIVVDVHGLAVAWTLSAVKVRWTGDYQARTDWLPAFEVRRSPPSWPELQHGSQQPARQTATHDDPHQPADLRQDPQRSSLAQFASRGSFSNSRKMP